MCRRGAGELRGAPFLPEEHLFLDCPELLPGATAGCKGRLGGFWGPDPVSRKGDRVPGIRILLPLGSILPCCWGGPPATASPHLCPRSVGSGARKPSKFLCAPPQRQSPLGVGEADRAGLRWGGQQPPLWPCSSQLHPPQKPHLPNSCGVAGEIWNCLARDCQGAPVLSLSGTRAKNHMLGGGGGRQAWQSLVSILRQPPPPRPAFFLGARACPWGRGLALCKTLSQAWLGGGLAASRGRRLSPPPSPGG